MKKILLLLLLMSTLKGYAQVDSLTATKADTLPPAKSDSLSSIGIGVGQDSFFGFYVGAAGAYTLSNRTNLTFYSNYWANPAFGNAVTGTDFWTEIGMGLNFSFLDKKLNINPSLGFTYGKVLSGGEKGVLGDGIVPSLALSFSNSRIDVSAGGFWFKALRQEGPVTIDFMWCWLTPGYKFNQRITAGAHFEEFYLSRATEAKPQNLYTWIGPYLQYNFPKGHYLRVTGGYDTVSQEFIKIYTYIPFSSL